MSLENTCECGAWKGEDYELCRDCSETKRAEGDEPVLVIYFARGAPTDKAERFKVAPGFSGRSVWVPKSLLRDVDTIAKSFCVPRWWAEQEALDYSE